MKVARNGKPLAVRFKNGRWERLCLTCRKWKSYDKFYFRKSAATGLLLPRTPCKLCTSKESGRRHKPHLNNHGLVSVRDVEEFQRALEKRIGIAETSRRTGISQGTLWKYRNRKVDYMYRRNAAAILEELGKVNKSGEMRTHSEIWQGTRLTKTGKSAKVA